MFIWLPWSEVFHWLQVIRSHLLHSTRTLPNMMTWTLLCLLHFCCAPQLADRSYREVPSVLDSSSYQKPLSFFRVYAKLYNPLQTVTSPSRVIQDSLGFWIPHGGFRIPGTGQFQILCQWNLDSGFLELHSELQSSGFRILQAKISRIPESGIRILLHGASVWSVVKTRKNLDDPCNR